MYQSFGQIREACEVIQRSIEKEAKKGIIKEYVRLSAVWTPLSLADMNRVEFCSESLIVKYSFST